MNRQSSHVRVPGPDQVLSTTEVLASVGVLGVPDDQAPGLGLPDPLGGGGVQVCPVLEPGGLGLWVPPGGQALEDGHLSLGHLAAHRHHPEVFL